MWGPVHSHAPDVDRQADNEAQERIITLGSNVPRALWRAEVHFLPALVVTVVSRTSLTTGKWGVWESCIGGQADKELMND